VGQIEGVEAGEEDDERIKQRRVRREGGRKREAK